MGLATGYLTGAATFALYATVTYAATGRRVRRGRPGPHDANRMRRLDQAGMSVIVLAWAALWPLTLAVHIWEARNDDDDSDPQDRVPPQFR